jgi:hypothetical protein
MKQILTILIILITYPVYSQVKALPFNGNLITTDQFGFYYEIGDTEIKKYSNSGELNCSYSNNLLGVIANVDVSNPQKILVYFKDFTKILILDNTLSPSSEVIDLTTIELDETSLVCRSYNDAVWYYDPVRFELIRKNQELITTNSSGNIANLLNKNIQPNFMIEDKSKVYLSDPLAGILVFDIYGTYLKTLPILGLMNFQVRDKFLIYTSIEGEIETYDFFTLEKSKYKPLKYNLIDFVRVENETIYIVDKKNQLFIDKIEQQR